MIRGGLLYFCTATTALAGYTEPQFIQRVHAHLIIQDPQSALDEVQQGLAAYPDSQGLMEAEVRVRAASGDDTGMLTAWNTLLHHFPEEQGNTELIEGMAWGVIQEASRSPCPLTRVFAVVGAFFSQDAKGVPVLLKGMRDSNMIVRGVSVQVASHMRDKKLKDEMLRLLRSEKGWAIRLEVIKALGSMKVVEAQPDLLAILSGDGAAAEEKAAAIQSLVNMRETADRQEVVRLASSDRAGLRLLACQIVSHFTLEDSVEEIVPLLKDNRSEVRAAALYALGILRVKQCGGIPLTTVVTPLLVAPDETVAVTAAWALTISGAPEGSEAFYTLLAHENREVRLHAAGALLATGAYGLPTARRVFNETDDPFVKMNVALCLITQRADVARGCDALYVGLSKEKGRWMWQEETPFRHLAPSKVKHQNAIPNFPEAVNQLARLDVLNTLAIMKYPHCQEAIKRFLQERTWGISAMASATLLTEGDEAAVDIVQALLSDPDPKVRMQAAQILALWGAGDTAVSVLYQSYPAADREMKERILEGIGRIGTRSSLPFLLEAMQEPYQSLRIIAASSILQCLYN